MVTEAGEYQHLATAVDTNIISALLSGSVAETTHAKELLQKASATGHLLISAVVFAELRAAPRGTEENVATMLEALRIEVDWNLDENVWRAAATAFRGYARRRRQEDTKSGVSKRLLADFVVGAHALLVTGRLLTFDQGKYRAAFPQLEILS